MHILEDVMARLVKMVGVGVVLMLGGCAATPQEPDMLSSEVQPTPICVGEEQCSKMWGRAIEAISTTTGMKLMTATDSFLQTYPTTKIGYMNGQVYKEKVGEQKYAIKGRFDCGGYSWCNRYLNKKQNLFNLLVQGYDPVTH